VSMVIMGDPSSELQQYLHLPGHPSVGMSIMWKGFFIPQIFPGKSKRVRIFPRAKKRGILLDYCRQGREIAGERKEEPGKDYGRTEKDDRNTGCHERK
jgi:hypothetical protein